MVITAYQAILLGTYYILIVSYVDVFRKTYNEDVGIASLNYLALALGSLTGRQGGTFVMDKLYRRLKARNNGEGTPEMRIILLSAACLSIPLGMIIFGWAVQYRVHWFVADLGAFFFTMGMVNVVFVVQTYTIEWVLPFIFLPLVFSQLNPGAFTASTHSTRPRHWPPRTQCARSLLLVSVMAAKAE